MQQLLLGGGINCLKFYQVVFCRLKWSVPFFKVGEWNYCNTEKQERKTTPRSKTWVICEVHLKWCVSLRWPGDELTDPYTQTMTYCNFSYFLQFSLHDSRINEQNLCRAKTYLWMIQPSDLSLISGKACFYFLNVLMTRHYAHREINNPTENLTGIA